MNTSTSKINWHQVAKGAMRPLLILSLTLGLAPFVPEPHILGKLRWVAGGGHGMQPMDYFDLVFHGFSWVLLLVSVVVYFITKGSKLR